MELDFIIGFILFDGIRETSRYKKLNNHSSILGKDEYKAHF